jgi:Putative zinc-finger
MTNDNHSPLDHPDELLVGYVDGSASAEERRAVDAHLVSCSQCREELALATKARTALGSLPELEAPGLAAGGIEGLRAADARDDLAARREAKREGRRARQWQASWVALGGVAAVLVFLAVLPFVLNRGGADMVAGGVQSAPEATPAPAPLYPGVVDRGFAYDQDSIQALAQELAGEKRTSGSNPLSSAPGMRAADASSDQVVRCAIEGTGLPSDTVPIYLEEATYEGTPAYVVAVRTEGGARAHLRVYAVSQEGCTFLFEADQPL